MPDALPRTMLDRGAFWTPAPDWSSILLEREGWTARPVPGLHRLLVSGNLHAAMTSLGVAAPSIGLWQIAEGDVQALRIGRDRMLITSAKPLPTAPGWNAGGFAISSADDAYVTIELAGPKLRELAAEMTFADLEGGSPSAATLVCGQTALLHRVAIDRAHLHVEAPLATYVWHWLDRR